MSERWRVVPSMPVYMVSNWGRVKRLAGTGRGITKDRVLTPQIGTTGYLMVMVSPKPRKPRFVRVHRLVASAFIRELTDRDVVNHLDGNKLNPRADNLEITTREGNAAHAAVTGLIRSGEAHGMAKLTEADVQDMRLRFAAGETGAAIAARYGISRNYAYQIKREEVRA